MQKLFRLLIGPAVLVVFIVSIFACVSSQRAPKPVKEKPGMYNLRGWQGQSTYFDGNTNVATGVDIDGEVGHPLSVSTPTARCAPTGNWNFGTISYVSGSLPPGITLERLAAISGIPTERGHWIVKLRMNSISCEGGTYSLEQELRFHITGSGRVNN